MIQLRFITLQNDKVKPQYPPHIYLKVLTSPKKLSNNLNMVNTGAITILASSLVLSELYSNAWETFQLSSSMKYTG